MKRSKAITLLVAVILGTGLIATQAAEKKAEVKKQTTCPVMGGQKINKALYVDVKGYRIYVCCKGCIDVIKVDPKGLALQPLPLGDSSKVVVGDFFADEIPHNRP